MEMIDSIRCDTSHVNKSAMEAKIQKYNTYFWLQKSIFAPEKRQS